MLPGTLTELLEVLLQGCVRRLRGRQTSGLELLAQLSQQLADLARSTAGRSAAARSTVAVTVVVMMSFRALRSLRGLALLCRLGLEVLLNRGVILLCSGEVSGLEILR